MIISLILLKRLHKNPNVNILIVEDSSPIREYEKNILKKMFFNVYSAKKGKEALKVFEQNEIDIVITDLVMDDMDELSLIKELRKKKKMSELPIIAISSVQKKRFFKILKTWYKRLSEKTF
ncbi:response regulator [Caminibacter sp.]